MEITAYIQVKNEAHLLLRCLMSIIDCVDEIIVLDDGSTDATSEVARSFGCKVVLSSEAKFDYNRNIVFEFATKPWILTLDADECLSSERCDILHQAVSAALPSTLAFSFPRYSYFGSGRWSNLRSLRIFRNHPQIRYNNIPIHASVSASILSLGGKITPIHVPTHHLDGLIAGRAIKKRQRNIDLAEGVLRQDNNNAFFHSMLGLEFAAIGQPDEAEKEYRAALILDPKCIHAHLCLAYLEIDRGNFTAAEREAQAVLSLTVHHFKEAALFVLAKVALLQSRQDRALHRCMEGLECDESSPSMHINTAFLLERIDPHEAINHLEHAISNNPYLLKPLIYTKGDTSTVWEVSDSLLPGVQTIYDHMANCYEYLKQESLAEEWKHAKEEVLNIAKDGDEERLLMPCVPRSWKNKNSVSVARQ